MGIALHSVLSLMSKAYLQNMDTQFMHCLQALFEEFNTHLDDKRVGQIEMDCFANPDPQLVEEMEKFMNYAISKRKE